MSFILYVSKRLNLSVGTCGRGSGIAFRGNAISLSNHDDGNEASFSTARSELISWIAGKRKLIDINYLGLKTIPRFHQIQITN